MEATLIDCLAIQHSGKQRKRNDTYTMSITLCRREIFLMHASVWHTSSTPTQHASADFTSTCNTSI
jgi:hypothetical protein